MHSLSTKVYKFCKNKLQVPVVCILCNNYLKEKNIICTNCYKLLPKLGHTCNICCAPLTNNKQDMCNTCQVTKPYFNKVYSAFLYEEPLKTLIHTFKYHNGLYLQQLLTDLLREAPIPITKVGIVLPVPLARQKLKQRGFNQAALIAKELATQLKVPYSDKHLQKTTHTANQVNLSKEKRKQNLTNSFKCKDIKHTTITLIDDIVTTGSTVNEVSKMLRLHGAKNINVCCIARAATNYVK